MGRGEKFSISIVILLIIAGVLGYFTYYFFDDKEEKDDTYKYGFLVGAIISFFISIILIFVYFLGEKSVKDEKKEFLEENQNRVYSSPSSYVIPHSPEETAAELGYVRDSKGNYIQPEEENKLYIDNLNRKIQQEEDLDTWSADPETYP